MASSQSALEQLSALSWEVEKAVSSAGSVDDLATDPNVARAIALRRAFVLDSTSGIDPLDAWLVLSYPFERIPRLIRPLQAADNYLREQIGAPVVACRYRPPEEDGTKATYSLLTGNLAGGFVAELPTESKGSARLYLGLEQEGFLLEGEMITLGPRPQLDFPSGESRRCSARDWPITVADLERALLRSTGTTILFNIIAGDREVVDFLIRSCVPGFEKHCDFPVPEGVKAAERALGKRADFIITQGSSLEELSRLCPFVVVCCGLRGAV